jgi:hypothetical protein
VSIQHFPGRTTDGAPAMVGKSNGVGALVEQYQKSLGVTHQLIKIHCIIHVEALCAKSVTMQHVLDVAVKTVNIIRARGLNHRQFKEMLQQLEVEYGDLLYHSNVRWLSRGNMLSRLYALRVEVASFCVTKVWTFQK